MSDDPRSTAMRAGEKAFKQTLRESQSDARERQAAEDEASLEAKIARLRAARLAKEAAGRS